MKLLVFALSFAAQTAFARSYVPKLNRFVGCGEIHVVRVDSALRLHLWIPAGPDYPVARFVTLTPYRANGSYATESVETFKSLEINHSGRPCLEGELYQDAKGGLNLVPTDRRPN